MLAHAEFSFNGLVNQMTGKAPFQIVYGQLPKIIIDFVNIPVDERNSVDVEATLENLKQTHEKVK